MIFIDTRAFVARHIERDQYHDVATKHWRSLAETQRRCFTTNFVLDETITLLARRSSSQFAAERGRSLFRSMSLSILRPEAHDELAALELFRKYADQRVSFTDCISFTLMDRHRIRRAFSFDHHFTLAEFEAEPLMA